MWLKIAIKTTESNDQTHLNSVCDSLIKSLVGYCWLCWMLLMLMSTYISNLKMLSSDLRRLCGGHWYPFIVDWIAFELFHLDSEVNPQQHTKYRTHLRCLWIGQPCCGFISVQHTPTTIHQSFNVTLTGSHVFRKPNSRHLIFAFISNQHPRTHKNHIRLQ